VAPKQRGVSASPKKSFAERGGVLMTVAEGGDYLGVTERQMWRLLNTRAIPKTKVGGLVRVHIDDLNAYIESQRVGAVQ
jgi:excisionase family DNA binding protein